MSSLIGRDREVQRLTALLSGGPGQAVLLLGDPGIGKSALLAAAGDAARDAGWQVLTAAGVESEAPLPFAGLHQVVRSSASPLAVPINPRPPPGGWATGTPQTPTRARPREPQTPTQTGHANLTPHPDGQRNHICLVFAG